MRPAHLLSTIFLGFSLTLLAGCSSSVQKPVIDELSLQTFFDGKLTAHGVVKNRGGDVTRRFNATIQASWEDGIGTLDEQFIFDDGEQQTRIWRLQSNGDGSWSATANDTVGTGIGLLSGHTFQLDYKLKINYRGGELVLNVDDRMWLVSPDVIINHSVLRKFGLRVGSIQLAIIKQHVSAAPATGSMSAGDLAATGP